MRGFSIARLGRKLRLATRSLRVYANWPTVLYGTLGGGKVTRVELRDGPAFELSTRTALANQYELMVLHEVFLIEHYPGLPHDGIVIDIGANIGAFSVQALRGGRRNRVFAYEPAGDTFRRLEDNVRSAFAAELDSGRVRLFHAAVAKERGEVALFGLDEESVHRSTALPDKPGPREVAPAYGLEDILADNELTVVDYLKIDSEGAEYETIYNAPERVLRAVRVILGEFHDIRDRVGDGDCCGERLVAYLERLGYRLVSRAGIIYHLENLDVRPYEPPSGRQAPRGEA
jgi:FkbM family methyltransferase